MRYIQLLTLKFKMIVSIDLKNDKNAKILTHDSKTKNKPSNVAIEENFPKWGV